MNNIDIKHTELSRKLFESTYPKYTLVQGGQKVIIEVKKDKYVEFGVHHIAEEGLLCDDLETYIKWEMFS